ncbi:putative intracellular [Operophtera brumata]|uniref:Putative intracellular n=1 Tax=Operophtera brumata TaxID=104452 RepID=A0A0L7KQJ3_OPEBR|nr:putative intracellular [Operophtera brumata]
MSVRVLPQILAEKARVELNEESGRVKDGLQLMKDWISKQPHLRARTDDQWLLAFLRGCKFSMERAKEKLDLYYSVRYTAPELYKFKHTDELFDEIFSLGVALIRPGRYDASKYDIFDVLTVVNILQKVVLMDDDNGTVAGNMTILDLQGVTLGHFLQMTPITMKKMMVAAQDATPLRMKGLHYINAPPGVETIFNAMKSLLNEKNRNRLFKHIPKDILPTEYGGNGGTTDEILDYWRKKLNEYNTFLEEDYQFGTDERKRAGKPKTAESMFGADGSFRKLEVD